MKALISGYARTPFHFANKGRLAKLRPDEMASQLVAGLLSRLDVDPAALEDVIAGCAYPEAAQGNNVARIVALRAGLPVEVGGMTVNRFCGSSMSAIHIAAAQIEASRLPLPARAGPLGVRSRTSAHRRRTSPDPTRDSR